MLDDTKPPIESVDEIDGYIGRCITQRREYLSLTQTAFADRLGLSAALAAQFEAGEHRIDPGMLMNIAEVLGVSVLDFFDEDAPGVQSLRNSAFEDAALMRQWRMDSELKSLVQAFLAIPDPKTRRKFLRMMQAISRPISRSKSRATLGNNDHDRPCADTR